MNSLKNKYLNNAQKFIQKGQLDKAAKEYEALVATDPNDVRYRQKLAELLARCNRRQDAVREYESVAQHYESNGFYLKAMAVYKQIQKLDPSRIEICLTIARLNEKQGLIGNALSEYKVVFDHYERLGQTADAIKILESMHGADPENIDIRAKLAETRAAAGLLDLAFNDYTAIAQMFKKRGNDAGYAKACSRIEKLFPEKAHFRVDLLKQQLQEGKAAEVVPQLRSILEKDDTNPEVHLLLGDAYRIQGDNAARKSVMQRMVQRFPDDPSAVIGLLECEAEDGEAEQTLDLLAGNARTLLSAGHSDRLEQVYKLLQAQSPYDVRVLSGLKELYEAVGDNAKLADIAVSLKILSDGLEKTEISPSAQPDIDSQTGADFDWEEAIELSIPGDEIDLAAADSEAGRSPSPDEQDSTVSEVLPWELPSEEMVVESTSLTPGDSSGKAEPAEFCLDEGESFEIDLTSFGEVELEDISSGPLESDTTPSDSTSPAAAEGPDWLDTHVQLESEPQETAIPKTAFLETGPEPAELETISLDHLSFEPGSAGTDAMEPMPCEPEGAESVSLADLSFEPEPAGYPIESNVDGLSGVLPDEPSIVPQDEPAFFAEPAAGPGKTVDPAEAEEHYNLGIAYKEMGLFEEAIKELDAASADPMRGVDCLTLKGICLREKGDLREAEDTLHSALRLCGDQQDSTLNVKYELATVLERAERREEALKLLREVFLIDPGFRDTVGMMTSLNRSGSALDLADLDQMDIELEKFE